MFGFGEPAKTIGNLLSLIGVLAPWKDDGTDSGRVRIQSNGIVAHI